MRNRKGERREQGMEEGEGKKRAEEGREMGQGRREKRMGEGQ